MGDIMEISKKEMNPKGKIIDIRPYLEFKKYHIPYSINIPKIKLLGSPDSYLNFKDTYYLVCSKGEISLFCSKILSALGYNCYSIIGGIDSFK